MSFASGVSRRGKIQAHPTSLPDGRFALENELPQEYDIRVGA